MLKLTAAWGVGLVMVLALMQWGVHEFSRRSREQQARREMEQLGAMLGKFRETRGHYPAVVTNAQLLLCLLGRADELGRPIKPKAWYLTGARLYFRKFDPRAAGNEIVDPWGSPYVYRHRPTDGEGAEGFLIVSAGADRRHSNPLGWPVGSAGSATEDRDNLAFVGPASALSARTAP